jgi:hypothetical protein
MKPTDLPPHIQDVYDVAISLARSMLIKGFLWGLFIGAVLTTTAAICIVQKYL